MAWYLLPIASVTVFCSTSFSESHLSCNSFNTSNKGLVVPFAKSAVSIPATSFNAFAVLLRVTSPSLAL